MSFNTLFPNLLRQDYISIADAPFNVSAVALDNTAGLQAAINAAIATGKPLYIPPVIGQGYRYTPPLNINGNITIVGGGVAENWNAGIDQPIGTPMLTGAVLCPASNGQNAINITGTSVVVHLRDLGILFQTLYSNTGDGINYTPPTASSVTAQGLSGSTWQNVKVAGHDGNHYAYNLTNPIYCTFNHVFGFGGGGWKVFGTAGGLHYGNCLWLQPYVQTYVAGTADAYNIDCGASTCLNLLTFIRPQGTVKATATSAQRAFYQGIQVTKVGIVTPDFESTTSSQVILPYNPTNTCDLGTTIVGGSVVFAPSNTPNKRGFLSSGQMIAGGSYNGATSGSVTFDQAFPNACLAVVLTGWGNVPKLAGAPTKTGFSYTQDQAGTAYYMAYGY